MSALSIEHRALSFTIFCGEDNTQALNIHMEPIHLINTQWKTQAATSSCIIPLRPNFNHSIANISLARYFKKKKNSGESLLTQRWGQNDFWTLFRNLLSEDNAEQRLGSDSVFSQKYSANVFHLFQEMLAWLMMAKNQKLSLRLHNGEMVKISYIT